MRFQQEREWRGGVFWLHERGNWVALPGVALRNPLFGHRRVTMAIADLISVCPPPENPDESGSLADLRKIETKMGVALPTDYRQFAVRYGSGFFVGTYLKIWNPFVIDIVRETATGGLPYAFDRGDLPWPPYPARPGGLEIGHNENGHQIVFLADGDPDAWPIIVIPHGAGKNEFERWDLPLGTFLAKALLNEITTAAVHPNGQPVEAHERVFTQNSDLWDYRGGKWVRKRKRRQ
jgi:SMI1/KNR4 family protein SUKH-1